MEAREYAVLSKRSCQLVVKYLGSELGSLYPRPVLNQPVLNTDFHNNNKNSNRENVKDQTGVQNDYQGQSMPRVADVGKAVRC